MPMHVKSWPKVKMYQAEVGSNIAQKCENFTKSEIYSNIAQNHFHSSQFDSIPHTHLWYHLLQDGIHGRIITVIRSLYSCLRSCVKVPEGLTEFFRCTVGTRQGCMISPFLFALYVNELVRLLDELGCPGMRIDEAFSNVNLLMYADDIALMNDTIGRLQNSIDILSTFCDKYGLMVNMSKTNVIIFRNGGPIRHNEHVFYRGDPILCHILQQGNQRWQTSPAAPPGIYRNFIWGVRTSTWKL